MMGGHACLCRGCGETFAGVSGFDKHRIGDYGVTRTRVGVDRRCMTRTQMQKAGMSIGVLGRWVSGSWTDEKTALMSIEKVSKCD